LKSVTVLGPMSLEKEQRGTRVIALAFWELRDDADDE